MREKRAEREPAAAVFNQLWNAYPEKKGKAKVSDKDKRRLAEIGVEQGLRAIDRYKKEVEASSYRHYQNGSTFFHSGIYDYLDNTYTPTVEKKTEAIQRRHKEETAAGVNLPSRKMTDQQRQAALEKNDRIMREHDAAAAIPANGSGYKGGAVAEVRRRQRKAVE